MAVNNKIVGPGYNEVQARYKDQPDAEPAGRQGQGRRAGRLGFGADAAEWSMKDDDQHHWSSGFCLARSN
jgi:cytochrome c551/c552